MLNAVKLKLFTKAVLLKVNAGAELNETISAYTALKDEEREQIKEAVLKEKEKE